MWDFEGPMRAFIVLVVLVIAMTGYAGYLIGRM